MYYYFLATLRKLLFTYFSRTLCLYEDFFAFLAFMLNEILSSYYINERKASLYSIFFIIYFGTTYIIIETSYFRIENLRLS